MPDPARASLNFVEACLVVPDAINLAHANRHGVTLIFNAGECGHQQNNGCDGQYQKRFAVVHRASLYQTGPADSYALLLKTLNFLSLTFKSFKSFKY